MFVQQAQTLTSSGVPLNRKEGLQQGLARVFWTTPLLDEPASPHPISITGSTLPCLSFSVQATLTPVPERGETYFLLPQAHFLS